MFLLVVWLGLPAVVLVLVGIHASVRASEKGPKWLLIALTVLAATTVFSVPVAVTTIAAGVYVAMVVVLGVSWLRSRDVSGNGHDV